MRAAQAQCTPVRPDVLCCVDGKAGEELGTCLASDGPRVSPGRQLARPEAWRQDALCDVETLRVRTESGGIERERLRVMGICVTVTNAASRALPS